MLIDFPPSRAAALKRLQDFAPHAGEHYVKGRNTDFGPDQPNAVSRLSPYLRYRLITEEETVTEILNHFSLSDSEKFVQEVLWRTYFKGWLEMRPTVWQRFIDERETARAAFHDVAAVTAAEHGATGIDGFDHWARELVETGYLHNHARMWFASIWIFTLRLPWTLGADFFLRHLIDADPASNTLSWRWVAGLQTPGKTYLATADNIARYTNGRFMPKGLAREAPALTEPPLAPPRAIPTSQAYDKTKPSIWLITHEDMQTDHPISKLDQIVAKVVMTDSSLLWGEKARDFVTAATTDLTNWIAANDEHPVEYLTSVNATQLRDIARKYNVQQIVTSYAPIGPVADALRKLAETLAQDGITLVEIQRSWDSLFWPDATRGFFPFKEKIATRLNEIGAMR